MSNNIHPTINDTLETFFQAIGAAQAPTRTDTLPALKRGLQRLDWPTGPWLTRPDTLTVDFYYYPGSPGRREAGVPMEMDEHPCAEVQAVWLAGVDIAPILSEDVLTRMEDYCLESQG